MREALANAAAWVLHKLFLAQVAVDELRTSWRASRCKVKNCPECQAYRAELERRYGHAP